MEIFSSETDEFYPVEVLYDDEYWQTNSMPGVEHFSPPPDMPVLIRQEPIPPVVFRCSVVLKRMGRINGPTSSAIVERSKRHQRQSKSAVARKVRRKMPSTAQRTKFVAKKRGDSTYTPPCTTTTASSTNSSSSTNTSTDGIAGRRPQRTNRTWNRDEEAQLLDLISQNPILAKPNQCNVIVHWQRIQRSMVRLCSPRLRLTVEHCENHYAELRQEYERLRQADREVEKRPKGSSSMHITREQWLRLNFEQILGDYQSDECSAEADLQSDDCGSEATTAPAAEPIASSVASQATNELQSETSLEPLASAVSSQTSVAPSACSNSSTSNACRTIGQSFLPLLQQLDRRTFYEVTQIVYGLVARELIKQSS